MGLCLFIGPSDKTNPVAMVSTGASTDNLRNRFVLNRLMTTIFPLLAFVCEMAVTVEKKGCALNVGWVPRDQNCEADALSNDDIEGFDPSKEIAVDLDNMGFEVLDDLLDLGDTFYEEAEKEKEKEKEDRRKALSTRSQVKDASKSLWKQKKKAPLRGTDPW